MEIRFKKHLRECVQENLAVTEQATLSQHNFKAMSGDTWEPEAGGNERNI